MNGRKLNPVVLIVTGTLVFVVAVYMMISAPGAYPQDPDVTLPEPITLDNLDEALATENVDRVIINPKSNRILIYILDPVEPSEEDETPAPNLRIETVIYGEGYEGNVTENLISIARANDFHVEVASGESGFFEIFLSFLPLILIGGFIFFLVRRAQQNNANGGVGGAIPFGKSKAKRAPMLSPIKFTDVAGMDEAIEDMREIKEFLAFPEKYKQLGAKIPKGVILVGPPGTGKTLLARATAGEAGVPFFSVSGSEFVEMFVGVGASRVRDTFDEARKNAPSVLFIDEIDAIGRHRGSGMGGSHDEREQTLNQILTEMDGFESRTNVIVIAATNRPDILDPALTRPGRFDRKIVVDAPDVLGREKILGVHAKGKPFDKDVDLASIARQTAGFTGADLENVLNEAAILAAKRDKKMIGHKEIEDSFDRVIAGAERRTRVMSENTKRVIAYHETGHALVGYALKHANHIQKITIISRGMSLGHTQSFPEEDQFLHTRTQLLDQIAMSLGGNAAEELVFGEPTTGASNDIQKATEIARNMIEKYGMSENIGRVGYGSDQMFLGRDMTQSKKYSEAVAAKIDKEVSRTNNQEYLIARQILEANRPAMERMVAALLERETVSGSEIDLMFEDVLKDGWIRTKDGVKPETD
ncbi:MAG: ATP-dependent zinc metalloprotease FtsH [Candidatus Spechtbacterales bacterium]